MTVSVIEKQTKHELVLQEKPRCASLIQIKRYHKIQTGLLVSQDPDRPIGMTRSKQAYKSAQKEGNN